MKRWWLACGLLVMAFSQWTGPVVAEDSCSAQCDAQAEKCSVQAGRDKDKARACDDAYDQCLAKCTAH